MMVYNVPLIIVLAIIVLTFVGGYLTFEKNLSFLGQVFIVVLIFIVCLFAL